MPRIVGIDLGTTNSAVAVWDGDRSVVIPIATGAHLVPSVVGFEADGIVHVGEPARHHAVANPSGTIYSAKRFIGRQFETVTADVDDVPYEVVEGERGEALFQVDDMLWSPEEISAMVLRELRRAAETYLGERIDGVVIGTPAHFNDAQRAATRKAASLAGLDVRRILNEPTAAALAYGLDRATEGEKIVAVYDFGGGTFDVSILSVSDDVIEVISTCGDTHLGGDAIDTRVAFWMLAEFDRTSGHPADEDAETLQRLREAAEQAKIALSDQDIVDITLPFQDEDGPIETSLAREDFEALVGDLVERTFERCERALADAGKTADQIDEIVLAGGTTRIPLVRRRVAEYFGREPLGSVDPDEVVARGAAVQAGILAGDLAGVVLVDVTSLSLGIETHDGRTVVVIPRNSTLPAEATRIFTTSQNNQTAVQFHVVQGEHESADRNATLNRFVLDGLFQAKAGTPKIEVTFTIDINGMVLVSARDIGSGREQRVTVSVATAAAREKPARASTPRPNTRPVVQVPAAQLGLPPPARSTLAQAEDFLSNAGAKLTRVDRASLMKTASRLRDFAIYEDVGEHIEQTRTALARVLARVRNSRTARGQESGVSVR